MSRQKKQTPQEIEREKFANEVKALVADKCDQINHYVAGCNSPFGYLQIAAVQENLRQIKEVLDIRGYEE